MNKTQYPVGTMAVLLEVGVERVRQDRLYGTDRDLRDGSGPTSSILGWKFFELARAMKHTNKDPKTVNWSSILLEEAFEAVAEEGPEKLREELIQVAAVAVAWVEALDRRQGR